MGKKKFHLHALSRILTMWDIKSLVTCRQARHIEPALGLRVLVTAVKYFAKLFSHRIGRCLNTVHAQKPAFSHDAASYSSVERVKREPRVRYETAVFELRALLEESALARRE